MVEVGSSASMFASNTLVTGGTFTQQQNINNINHRVEVHPQGAGFELLQQAVAPAAFHDSGERFDPPRCHPNTRTAILDKIMQWTTGKDPDPARTKAFLMWLYGPAGAGKSAIAQTIAELCQEEGILLAGFFFSRTDPTRNHARPLVASIVYQMIMLLPQAKDTVVALIEQDPLIFTRSIHAQLDLLLFRPCKALLNPREDGNSPLLIVIDGLDECIEPKVQINILDALYTAHKLGQLPSSIHFLIASRPEPHIMSSFNLQIASIHRLALDNTYHPSHDIRLFLHDKFKEIARNHLYASTIPLDWPKDDVIEELVDKSSGQFIYASTVIKYISSVRHQPAKQLEVVLGLRPAQRHMPFAELDALYTHVLTSAEDLAAVLQILALRILGIEATTTSMEALLGLDNGDIPVLLGDIASLAQCTPMSTLWKTPDLTLQIFHASLKDFLFDESRSKNMYIDPALRHAEFAHLGFQHIRKRQTGKSASSGYSESITRDVLQSIPHHMKHAVLTSDLRHDVQRLSGEALIKSFESQGWEYVGDLLSFWCSIIQALEALGATDLYAFHSKQLYQFLGNNIEAYYTQPYLTLLVALVSVDHLPSTDIPAPTSRIVEIDKERLRILSPSYRGRKFHFDGPYLTMLRNFLSDPQQCGSNGLTSERYATAVWYCLRELVDDWPSVSGVPGSTDPGRFEIHNKYLVSREHSKLPCIAYVECLLEKAASTGSTVTLSSILQCGSRPRRRPARRSHKRVENMITHHLKQHSIDSMDGYRNLQAILEEVREGEKFEEPDRSNVSILHISRSTSASSSRHSSGSSIAHSEVIGVERGRKVSQLRKIFKFPAFKLKRSRR